MGFGLRGAEHYPVTSVKSVYFTPGNARYPFGPGFRMKVKGLASPVEKEHRHLRAWQEAAHAIQTSIESQPVWPAHPRPHAVGITGYAYESGYTPRHDIARVHTPSSRLCECVLQRPLVCRHAQPG